jgi:hypothetical protein
MSTGSAHVQADPQVHHTVSSDLLCLSPVRTIGSHSPLFDKIKQIVRGIYCTMTPSGALHTCCTHLDIIWIAQDCIGNTQYYITIVPHP